MILGVIDKFSFNCQSTIKTTLPGEHPFIYLFYDDEKGLSIMHMRYWLGCHVVCCLPILCLENMEFAIDFSEPPRAGSNHTTPSWIIMCATLEHQHKHMFLYTPC